MAGLSIWAAAGDGERAPQGCWTKKITRTHRKKRCCSVVFSVSETRRNVFLSEWLKIPAASPSDLLAPARPDITALVDWA